MEPKKPEIKKKEEKKGNGGLIALLVVSLLLNVGLGIGLFMIYNKSNHQEQEIAMLKGEVTAKDAEVVSKTHELENLRLDLERIKEERERLGLENDSLDLQIASLNGTISKLRKTSRLDKAEKAKLERLIADLRGQVVEKDRQIAQLQLVNDSLSTGLSMLSEEKTKLGDSLTSTADALAYAAILKAEGINVVGIKENDKEITGDELKGSKLDRIKVSFTLADNKAAKKNTKTFFVALTTPKGEVFSDPNNGGGMITLADGTEVLYTMNQSLDFNNTNQKMGFTMLKGFNYTPGEYKVSVYSEGYKIGDGGFKVK